MDGVAHRGFSRGGGLEVGETGRAMRRSKASRGTVASGRKGRARVLFIRCGTGRGGRAAANKNKDVERRGWLRANTKRNALRRYAQRDVRKVVGTGGV